MKKYNPKSIESKWQKKWEEEGAVKIDKDDRNKEKFYVLDMFPYPSGDGLHMGHTKSYTSSDIFYRYKRMKGFNVLHPQGFDSFGLPAENYAIKTGVHPKKTIQKNIKNYIRQMKSLGIWYDFDEKIITSSTEYYKWTQWIFTKFFDTGLVYKKTDTINWCKSCKTGLANEQVEGGKCERCKNEVEQKKVPGWFLKITDFADELIDGLEDLDWPKHTKKNQINWIGKSEGSEIEFRVKTTLKACPSSIESLSLRNNSLVQFKVFTTRPDTLFGVTYCVLSPEHMLVGELKDNISNWNEVQIYVDNTNNKTERERLEAKEKTGVELKGVRAINPANNEEIPVFIADYVLANYGTGAIMAVPAHDERDFEFAKKFKLEIRRVIKSLSVYGDNGVHTEHGELLNSGKFNGMDSEKAKVVITEFVGGKITNNYRLRDWSISRQRYWGTPIPIVYDTKGIAHAVPEEYLPWTLPEDVDFIPKGISPLADSKELIKRTENIFGKGWTPEVDTMDTFVDSSWYFLRYPDSHNEKEFCSTKRLEYWTPPDLYIGGEEHTYMHLLYARFFTMAMCKVGLINFTEPFPRLRHQGMVLDKEGVKMSKSKGNVVNPDDMIELFGADAVRMYMMFAGPLSEDVIWNEDGVVGIYRFLEKVWKLQEVIEDKMDTKIESEIHKTVKKVENDLERLKFNTAISAMMTLLNTISSSSISSEYYGIILQLLAPFAPHMTEELWHELGNDKSIHLTSWPVYDKEKIKEDKVTIVVQVNGNVRGEFKIDISTDEDVVKNLAKKQENVIKWIDGKQIKKLIYIKNKLVNIVV